VAAVQAVAQQQQVLAAQIIGEYQVAQQQLQPH
jgi:hypothetical protein